MLLVLLGAALAVLVIALGVAFGILLAQRLQATPVQDRWLVFWKPVRLVLLGIGAFALVGWIYYRFIPL